MPTIRFIFTYIATCLTLITLPGCKADKETIENVFEIPSEYLNKEIDNSAGSFSIPVNTTLSTKEWQIKYTEQWITAFQSADKINVSVQANTGEKRSGTINVTSSVRKYTISITQYGPNTVIVESDFQVKPYGGKDSEHQDGQDISNTFDDKFSDDGGTPFHTPWGRAANFPVTLEYYFRGDTEIDYIIYYTRSGNGNFGKVDIYTATDEGRKNYERQGNYDFGMQSAPSKVVFEQPVKATGIKFEVHSGLGDFVSCDEMQFFKRNTEKTLPQKLLTVFTDITCSELKSGVSQEQIDALPEYFIRVAEALRNNTYDEWEKKFRVHEYEAYSNVEKWAEKLMTKKYSNLDNPTGISVEKGDEVIILVGDTHHQNISLQCIGEEKQTETGGDGNVYTYVQTAASGESYFLEEGVNKITMRSSGQLFIMYNTDITSANAKPVKIHIPLGSGKVSGYFDLKTDKTDERYAELLSKATHKYFCVRGEKVMFYFHRTKMREHLPNTILSAINLWDDIIGWQQELMGIEDVRPSQVNNHIFAISPEGSYMWASDYRIAFTTSKLGDILLKDNVMAVEDNAWGPAHEIGHVHQMAINWASSTESSNNLFSNYVIYKLGKYKSRGNGLREVATARYANKQAWYNMGDATHQNEDTEVHMRMNWQLWNYYHRCGYKNNFWQTLFNLLREVGLNDTDNPGQKQLEFAKMASKAANENLTDFFEMWGFFMPVNATIEQYGKYPYIVNQSMIDAAKEYMSRFPAPKHAFQYIEDRKKDEFPSTDYRYAEVGDVGYYSQFQNNQKINKTPSVVISGKSITISNGDEAVAFEIRKGTNGTGELLYFSNFFQFTVPSSVDVAGASLYAVQADGERKFIQQI